MKPRTAAVVAWVIWGLAVSAAGVGAALLIYAGGAVFGGLFFLMPLGYCTVGALIARRHHANPIGWLMLLIGTAFAVGGLGENIFERTGAPVALAVSQVGIPIAFGATPLMLLLFPDGRLPSSRWRLVGGALTAAVGVGVVANLLRPRLIGAADTSVPNPLGVESLAAVTRVVGAVAGVVGVAAGLACIAAIVVRYRRSVGDERQQIRWLAYVGGTAAILLGLTFTSGYSVVGDLAYFGLAFVLSFGVPIATGVAILKYRLYDLDIVVRKTLVAGVLAAFVTLGYFLVVIGIPTMVFGAGGGLRNTVPFLAAAVLAMAFQPVRRAARRLADRLVYGKRATPYEVLSEFSLRVGGTYAIEDVLHRMARIIAEGTGAKRAEVWLRVGGELHREGVWPQDQEAALSLRLDGPGIPPLSGVDLALPVRDRGELLGAIAVAMPRNEPLTAAGEKLVHDLASQAGLVLRNAGLIEELRASRKRLVAAQDEERRRLERNIHDGAQQQLVALAVRLNLVESLAEKDPARAREMAAGVKAGLQEALEDLRDLARGIYPPLLTDKGLPPALEAQARKAPVPVVVQSNGVGRYPEEVEAAVYFCVLEALQNAAKYAEASRVDVRLEVGDGQLRFEVTDDGKGFDPAGTPPGSGLQNMRDRLEALGGRLEIRSRAGHGTTVDGRIPAGRAEDVS